MSLESVVLVRDLSSLAAPWHRLFGRSAPLEMAVIGTHVLSMLVAGGLAIAHDRATLRAGRWTSAIREHHMGELQAVHRTIVAALAICVASGVALFAADVTAYAGSVPFWTKMALIVALLANALVMTSTEGSLRVNAGGAAAIAWSRLRATSIASIALWGAIVAVSIVLSQSK